VRRNIFKGFMDQSSLWPIRRKAFRKNSLMGERLFNMKRQSDNRPHFGKIVQIENRRQGVS
jgi:hypothetical protein